MLSYHKLFLLPFPFKKLLRICHIWQRFNLLYYSDIVVDVHYYCENWHGIDRLNTSNIKYCWRLVPCVITIKLFHHNTQQWWCLNSLRMCVYLITNNHKTVYFSTVFVHALPLLLLLLNKYIQLANSGCTRVHTSNDNKCKSNYNKHILVRCFFSSDSPIVVFSWWCKLLEIRISCSSS